MATQNLERIIDGDGHVMEDLDGIVKFLPDAYRNSQSPIRDPFPPSDHLHVIDVCPSDG